MQRSLEFLSKFHKRLITFLNKFDKCSLWNWYKKAHKVAVITPVFTDNTYWYLLGLYRRTWLSIVPSPLHLQYMYYPLACIIYVIMLQHLNETVRTFYFAFHFFSTCRNNITVSSLYNLYINYWLCFLARLELN